jgi:uncharacterized membrane protein YedE/YeeE
MDEDNVLTDGLEGGRWYVGGLGNEDTSIYLAVHANMMAILTTATLYGTICPNCA